MPFFESLPYIDAPPSPASLAAARSLILAESQSQDESAPPPDHPERIRIPPLDLSRYESPSSLSSSRTAQTYLALRNAHLSLLDAHGRNAWLLSNHVAEADLHRLHEELATVKREVDHVNALRKQAQERVAGEMRGLDDAWRAGLGRAVEVEVALGEVREGIRRALADRP